MFVRVKEKKGGRMLTDCIINTDMIMYILPYEGGYDVVFSRTLDHVEKIHTNQESFTKLCEALGIEPDPLKSEML